jgi:hypothetical protein
LVTGETDSPETITEYRRLNSPKLFYLPLHALDNFYRGNAIMSRVNETARWQGWSVSPFVVLCSR